MLWDRLKQNPPGSKAVSQKESLRAFLREEITSEIKNLLVESQREMLRLLKPETREREENVEEETKNEPTSFHTPTKSVRINSTHNNDPSSSRNSTLEITLVFSCIECYKLQTSVYLMLDYNKNSCKIANHQQHTQTY